MKNRVEFHKFWKIVSPTGFFLLSEQCMVFLFLNPSQHNYIHIQRRHKVKKKDDQSESVRTIEISGSRYVLIRHLNHPISFTTIPLNSHTSHNSLRNDTLYGDTITRKSMFFNIHTHIHTTRSREALVAFFVDFVYSYSILTPSLFTHPHYFSLYSILTSKYMYRDVPRKILRDGVEPLIESRGVSRSRGNREQ